MGEGAFLLLWPLSGGPQDGVVKGWGISVLSINDLYFSDCQTKLSIAKGLQVPLGAKIFNDQLAHSLERLDSLALELSNQMMAMNFGLICSACAAKPGGGCCSLAIADENDALQLLMNLLAGVAVDICRDNGQECYFLGSGGCTLTFKPIFCLNYDCSAIKTCSDHESFFQYGQLRGRLLQEQWHLEKLLIERLEQLGELK